MKILITLLLALFIFNQAHAQSHAEVLEKGRILQQYDYERGFASFIVAYNNWVYDCYYNKDFARIKTELIVRCDKIKDSNKEVRPPQ
jgi:hypothetical protein